MADCNTHFGVHWSYRAYAGGTERQIVCAITMVLFVILFPLSECFPDQGYNVYYDLQKDHSGLHWIEETELIDFSQFEYRNLLVTGWSHMEKTHTWATGRHAEIAFFTFHPEQEKRVKLLCAPYSGLASQSMEVLLNGHPVAHFDLSKEIQWYKFTLEAQHQMLYQNSLEFRFSGSLSPAETSQSADRRQLAVAFFRLEVSANSANLKRPKIKQTHLDLEGPLLLNPETLVSRKFLLKPQTLLKLNLAPPTDGSSHRVILSLVCGDDREILLDETIDSNAHQSAFDLKKWGGAEVTLELAHTSIDSSQSNISEPLAVEMKLKEPSKKGEMDNGKYGRILLIVVDTLRADFVGCYGGPSRTPHIDALAENGIRFTRAYSHIPITLPSHDAIFSSHYPHQNLVVNNGQLVAHRHMTIAEILSGFGYYTSAVVSLGTLNKNTSIDRGFAYYKDTSDTYGWFKTAATINQETRAMLPNLDSHDRWFFFLHYMDPHNPYYGHGLRHQKVTFALDGNKLLEGDIAENVIQELSLPVLGSKNILSLSSNKAFFIRSLKLGDNVSWQVHSGEMKKVDRGWLCTPELELMLDVQTEQPESVKLSMFIEEPLTVQQIRSSYQKEVEYVDNLLGRILKEMQDQGLLKDTLIIFTADHGEGLGDHNLIAHEQQLYDTLTHVPLIISHPSLPRGEVLHNVVRHIDLLPTVLDLLEVPATEYRGQSLLPIIEGQDNQDRPALSMTFRPEAVNNLVSLVSGKWKIIRNVDTGSLELYNITSDPEELDDLGEKQVFRLNRMERDLDKFLEKENYNQKFDELSPRSAISNSEELEKLRGLGYVK